MDGIGAIEKPKAKAFGNHGRFFHKNFGTGGGALRISCFFEKLEPDGKIAFCQIRDFGMGGHRAALEAGGFQHDR